VSKEVEEARKVEKEKKGVEREHLSHATAVVAERVGRAINGR
jgi:hypothetical protein